MHALFQKLIDRYNAGDKFDIIVTHKNAGDTHFVLSQDEDERWFIGDGAHEMIFFDECTEVVFDNLDDCIQFVHEGYFRTITIVRKASRWKGFFQDSTPALTFSRDELINTADAIIATIRCYRAICGNDKSMLESYKIKIDQLTDIHNKIVLAIENV